MPGRRRRRRRDFGRGQWGGGAGLAEAAGLADAGGLGTWLAGARLTAAEAVGAWLADAAFVSSRPRHGNATPGRTASVPAAPARSRTKARPIARIGRRRTPSRPRRPQRSVIAGPGRRWRTARTAGSPPAGRSGSRPGSDRAASARGGLHGESGRPGGDRRQPRRRARRAAAPTTGRGPGSSGSRPRHAAPVRGLGELGVAQSRQGWPSSAPSRSGAELRHERVPRGDREAAWPRRRGGACRHRRGAPGSGSRRRCRFRPCASGNRPRRRRPCGRA